MKPRHHFLEKALEDAILENHLGSVRSNIKLIQKSSGPSLDCLDDQGRSFLFLALEKSNNDIIKVLFSSFENDDDVLFCKTKDKRTLLHIAILKGHHSIVVKLLEIAVRKNKLDIYLEEDNQGCTPLHYAALLGKAEIVELLLKTDETLVKKIINRVNKEGSTALHCAFKASGCKSIEHLINHGAKLDLRNNKRQTPMMLFANLEQERQMEIFFALTKQRQNHVLQLYRKYLIANYSEDIKNNYFKLVSSHSLQALLIAHHEFNANIPLRNTITRSSRQSENKNKDGAYDVIEQEEYISDVMLTTMPLYAKKVWSAEGQKHKKEEKNNIEIMHQSNDDMLDSDRMTLISLIDDIEKYLHELQGRPLISTSNRVLAVLVPLVISLTCVGIESWFWYKQSITPRHIDYLEYEYYDNLQFVFGMGGGIPIVLLDIFLPMFFWGKEPNISRKEWEPLINQLKQDLLEKLQELEEKEKMSNEHYLPTQQQNIRDIEEQTKRLGEWGPFVNCNIPSWQRIKLPSSNQRTSKVLDVFTRLKNIVETIQQDLNLSKKPLSLFPQPPMMIPVDSDSDYDSEDELLPKRKKNAGCSIL